MASEDTAAHRWAVVDVPDPRAPRTDERVTMTFRTWIGAQWARWRWTRQHKREGCWPECSTLWHYEVRRLG
jgi:hypothetical protein